MRRCIYCERIIVAGGHGEEGEFCSKKCQAVDRKLQEGFCSTCLSETTDEAPGKVYSLNAIGTMLMGTRWNPKGTQLCPNCGSVVQQKWVTFGVGIVPLGTYRILYLRKGFMENDFVGRRLRNDPVPSKGNSAMR